MLANSLFVGLLKKVDINGFKFSKILPVFRKNLEIHLMYNVLSEQMSRQIIEVP